MKFLVIDDHPLVREGLASLLKQLGGVTEVLQASDGAEGLALAAGQPDLACVLVDLKMAGMDGLATVEALTAQYPLMPVVVISSSEEPVDVRLALRAGARGYCPKSSGSGTILAAVRLVLDGAVYVPPLMVEATLEASAGRGEALTDRQTEVLRLLCKGHPNKGIGRLLDMQEKTVKGHVTAIFRALGVVNRTQAVEAARRIGITA
ncbi:MAG: response regulator [Rhodoferax sp.]